MPKYYGFPSQPKSDDCPEIPTSVRVWGDHAEEQTKNDRGAATAVLSRVLDEDPSLVKDHEKEFLSPDDYAEKHGKKEKPKKSKSSKS
tara:strand:+ start:1078 stop:1341 length:264 start_codon:yes stop_codon:yes gene_type:complete